MRPPPLPPPPERLPHIDLLPWTGDLWRIQNDLALVLRRHPVPRFRFDAPDASYAVTYACADLLGAFAETYRERGRRLGDEDGARYLIRLTPRRPLPVVDLRSEHLRVALHLDERISVGEDYQACQAWAQTFFRRLPAFGICYRSRMADALVTNVALFTERCQHDLAVVALGRLRQLESVVLAAADRYNLTVHFLFE